MYTATPNERKAATAAAMDTDNSYLQNVILAFNSVETCKHCYDHIRQSLIEIIQRIWPVDGKTPELNLVLTFTKEWMVAINDNSDSDGVKRKAITEKWLTKYRKERTPTGATAGGLNKTDRNPDLIHTLDTLDEEIACALLPMDFDIYNIPGSIHRRAKEMVAAKESPWKEWSRKLRHCPGILDYSRTAIFALIRSAAPNVHMMPGTHQAWINAKLTETDHANPSAETLALAMPSVVLNSTTESSVDAISEPVPDEASTTTTQPEVKRLGSTVFSIEGLMSEQSDKASDIKAPLNEVVKEDVKLTETTSNEQMETTVSNEITCGAEIPASESVDADGEEVIAVEPSAHEYPAYFEPGRYEGLPNDVYHGANGISSTQVKDSRVSLMYFNARHVAKTIPREGSKVLDMGNLVHGLALQPENLDEEFSVEPVIPEGAFTTAATIRSFIDEHNASLPPQLSADEIKALLEEYNTTLPAQISLGASLDETAQSYMALPEEFQRIDADQKQTAASMKACIKEYNATLPAQVKTSGSRDVLLEQLAVINPDLVAQEAQKQAPLKVSGTKADLSQAVKSVKPDAVFADELLDAWRENPADKILVTRQQMATALDIQSALLAHPTAGMLLKHPSRAVEVSYFGFDDETGLEVRVRPDLEIDLEGVRIGADLKTISMWNVKQEGLRAKLHREIIDRDYHLSAAMYCEIASLDQFFWIFVNKDENYHWIAIVEASAELLELGMLEYRKSMRAIATSFDTGEWPAPITADYTDELNDFDMRRLEALRLA
jgi:exodeoxyribonuclease VIII